MGDRVGQPTRRHEPYLPHHRRQGCSCLTGISLQLAVCSPEQLSETSAHPRVQSKVRVEEGEEETEREREQEKAEEGGKEMGRKWKRAKKRKRLRRKEGKKERKGKWSRALQSSSTALSPGTHVDVQSWKTNSPYNNFRFRFLHNWNFSFLVLFSFLQLDDYFKVL